MNVLDEISQIAEQDFQLLYSIYDVDGPTINVGEEFKVQFRIAVTSFKFRWHYVRLDVYPDLQVVSVVPGQDFEEITSDDTKIYRKHIEDFEYLKSETIKFRAKAELFPAPGRWFCYAKVFAREGHLRVWNGGKPHILCHAFFGERLLKCPEGHEHPASSGFSFCPDCGYKYDSPVAIEYAPPVREYRPPWHR